MPATSSFSSTISTEANGTVMRLIGDAGVSHCDALSRALLPIAAQRPPRVVFDLSELAFISSLGLGILIEFQRGLARYGGDVRLAAPQTLVRDMLVKCRFDAILPIFDSVSEALG